MENKDLRMEIYHRDNLELLKELCIKHPEGLIDLIYIDPPFNSNRDYFMKDSDEVAFSDKWAKYDCTKDLEEIKELCPELHKFLMVLKDDC